MGYSHEDAPKTHITWSDNKGYLDRFSEIYASAQMFYSLSGKSEKFLTSFWDAVSELYRMELAYFDKAKTEKKQSERDEMEAVFEILEDDVEFFLEQDEFFKTDNHINLRKKINVFFTRLNEIAVNKGFFPKIGKIRTVDDVANTLKQR